MSDEWIDSEDVVVFEQGKDPGMGQLRLVGHLEKVYKIGDKHDVSLKEAYQIVFGKGTSTFISEIVKTSEKDGKTYSEKQFRLAGLTDEGRPLLVVITPRDNGTAKRIITAWQLSKDSNEIKKLLNDCPLLKDKYERYQSERENEKA